MCGIFAIYNHKDAAELTYLGLFGLQHRGQESTGIITSDGEKIYRDNCKGMGLVSEVYVKMNKEAREGQVALENLLGNTAIGHVRYSTEGSTTIRNAQPITHSCYYGIDTPTREELIASSKSVKEIEEFIGADSLGYLSKEGMLKCTRRCKKEFCTACFDGKYPVL